MAGTYPEERRKHRLDGMADELKNPPKDMVAVKAANDYFERIKRQENEARVPGKNKDKASEKRKQNRINALSGRKLMAAVGAKRAKEALWKFLTNLAISKKSDENGISVKQA